MKVVAGLGNPGARYAGTRHNVGFDVLDRLARQHRLVFDAGPVEVEVARWRRADGEVALLVKPLTFMNVSGEAVGGVCRFFKVDVADVLVVCDDVNLPLGRLRARPGGSEGGHNGLRSVAEHLGTTEYARLRIGVGRGDLRRDLADHVLARFEPDERPGMEDAIVRAAEAVDLWLSSGTAEVMNAFNRAAEES